VLDHAGRADIIGDVPADILRWKAECAVGRRNVVVGVVAQNQNAALTVSVDAAIRRSFDFVLPRRISSLLHRLSSYYA
jgi:hypothetical protein